MEILKTYIGPDRHSDYPGLDILVFSVPADECQDSEPFATYIMAASCKIVCSSPFIDHVAIQRYVLVGVLMASLNGR
jgi:hypothetical protein